ncbi:MAG: SHOCT domain-containing protein [Anaerolineales bacterium]|nr:SHOCT domain-containing protein [Anaerolineales bacterium]
MMWWGQHMMGFGGAIWMIIFWVVILGGGIWLLATIFPRASSASDSSVQTNDDPLVILKQRYARGELTKEEFETIRHDLEQA